MTLRDKAGLVGEGAIGFDPDVLSLPPNVIISRGDNLALFEYKSPGVYEGHYFFSDPRSSFADARSILEEIFVIAEVIKGLTPLGNKKALQMTARLGFKNYGNVTTPVGEMRLSILTKKEFMNE